MENEKKMPGFTIYRESAIALWHLSNDEAGSAIRAIAHRFLNLKETEPEVAEKASLAFDILCENLEQGKRSYEKKRLGGQKGGNARAKDT